MAAVCPTLEIICPIQVQAWLNIMQFDNSSNLYKGGGCRGIGGRGTLELVWVHVLLFQASLKMGVGKVLSIQVDLDYWSLGIQSKIRRKSTFDNVCQLGDIRRKVANQATVFMVAQGFWAPIPYHVRICENSSYYCIENRLTIYRV